MKAAAHSYSPIGEEYQTPSRLDMPSDASRMSPSGSDRSLYPETATSRDRTTGRVEMLLREHALLVHEIDEIV